MDRIGTGECRIAASDAAQRVHQVAGRGGRSQPHLVRPDGRLVPLVRDRHGGDATGLCQRFSASRRSVFIRSPGFLRIVDRATTSHR